MIDTGSASKYIKFKLVEKLKLPCERTTKHEAIIANGSLVSSDKVTEVNVKLQNDNNIEHKLKPHIKKLSNRCYIGMEFLSKNNVIIDLKNKL